MAHPGGRPTSYKPEYNEQAYKMCLLGATDKQLADFLGVDEATVNRWKIAHPEFCESLKNGKDVADAKVAESLYHRARGYEHPEDDIKVCDKEIIITPTIKHYPPDTGACMAWLKNRQPEKWRDKHEVDQTNHYPDGININFVSDNEQNDS